MSDRANTLDLDALSEALQQLHIATGVLSRALPAASRNSHDEWEVVDSEPPALAPPGPVDPPSGSSPTSRRFSPGYPSTSATPTLPADCLFLCSTLGAAVRQPRAQRAWTAGLEAGKVLRGEIDCVPPTPELLVKSRVYIVLCTPSSWQPRFFRNFSEFKAYTGKLRHGTVCHGFPTEGEARVYCRAASVPFPEPASQQ